MIKSFQLRKKNIDFLIVGSLCNNDIFMASQLIKMGFCIEIFRHRSEIEILDQAFLKLCNIDKSQLVEYQNTKQFLKHCLNAKVIISFAGSLIFYLNKALYITYINLLPPIISIATGSDLYEAPFHKSITGHRYRVIFKRSFLVVVVPMGPFISACNKLLLNRIMFIRHPYFIWPHGIKKEILQTKETITFVHTSNIDWGHNDKGLHRKSFKGTDKFIAAFIEASKHVSNIRCIMLERGPDLDVAKQMIAEQNCHAFEWMKPTTTANLPHILNQGDVIVDQFVLGGFGAIAIESMSLGKPLLTYVDPIYSEGLFHNDHPPIFNAKSEKDILNQILYISKNPHEVQKRGQKAAEWTNRNYNNNNRFIDMFMMLDARFGYDFIDKVRKRQYTKPSVATRDISYT